jgi:hypothetical protein
MLGDERQPSDEVTGHDQGPSSEEPSEVPQKGGRARKVLKYSSPVGYAAVKAGERREDPERQAGKSDAKQAKADAKQAQADAKAEQEARRGALVAKFSPGFTSIRVYADGSVEWKGHGGGSIIGATAHVDQAGSKRIFRDTRQSYLTIEGPKVAIAVKLASNSGGVVASARKFAAQVNGLAQQFGGTAATPQPASAAAPADSIPDQIAKLAELRDAGALTAEEFAAKKTELLKRM